MGINLTATDIEKNIFKGPKVLLIASAIFGFIPILLYYLYSLPLKDAFLWYVGVFLYFFVPGNLLLRYLALHEDEFFSSLFHSIALGTALTPLIYSTFRRIQHPEFIFIFGVVLCLIWLGVNVRGLKKGKDHPHTSLTEISYTLSLLLMVLLLLHMSYFTDIIFLNNGFKFRISDLTEADFHLGIINNLKNMYPPLLPYASGTSASHYHLNMHLEIEMLNRVLSIDTKKLTFFYFPFLYFCLLVFIPYIFIRKFWGLKFVGFFTSILIFSSDLSFIPGILGGFNLNFPWTVFFKTTIWSLFSLNGYLPALFIMFLSILYLKKFYEEGRTSYLLVFSLLAYSSFGFKSSMGPHLIEAALLTGFVSLLSTEERRKGVLLCSACMLIALAIITDVMLFRKGTGNVAIGFDLFNGFRHSLKFLKMYGITMDYSPLNFIIYVIGSFGVRILGFSVIKDLFVKRKDPIIVFLLIFTISGFLFSELISITSSQGGIINNANWFSIQSIMGALFLFSYFLRKVSLSGKRFFIYSIIIILFSMPTTIQFLSIRFNSNYYTFDHDAIEIMEYLEQTPVDSVILHPPNIRRPSLSANFTGRQSIYSYYHSFVSQTRGEVEAKRRLKDLAIFFKSEDIKRMPIILKKYKVNYVYAPLKYAPRLDKEPLLKLVLKNNRYVLYKVSPQ